MRHNIEKDCTQIDTNARKQLDFMGQASPHPTFPIPIYLVFVIVRKIQISILPFTEPSRSYISAPKFPGI